jgi:organic hydroperoxide reductase OsmC/OhrA
MEVSMTSLQGSPTAIGSAGPYTLIADRPRDAGGGGLGFNGGQLLNLAVAACVSNDLFREAANRGIAISQVRVKVTCDYVGDPAVATPIEYEVEIQGGADGDELESLVRETDSIAEIPNSLRRSTEVVLGSVSTRQV